MENLVLHRFEQQDNYTTSENEIQISNSDYCFILNSDGEPFVNIFSRQDGTCSKITIDSSDAVLRDSFQYLSHLNQIFIATSGSLWFYSLEQKKCIFVHFESPIAACKWDQSEEILAVYHANNSVGLYSIFQDAETYTVLSFASGDAKPKNDAYAGWTSSATTKGNVPSLQGQYKCTNNTALIRWKAYDNIFLINYFNGNQRMIKVLNKECEILFMSDDSIITGLEAFIAIRSKSDMIAYVQNDGDHQSINLMERIGIEHCQSFQLKSLIGVFSIEFSPCGNCFAIGQRNETSNWIDLYVFVNYKWVHKQCIPSEDKITGLKFKTNNFNKCVCIEVSYQGKNEIYEFIKKVVKCSFEDNVICCVVQSNELLTYCFSNSISTVDNIDSFHKLELESCVKELIFDDKKPILQIIDAKHNVATYDYTDWRLVDSTQLENYIKKDPTTIPLFDSISKTIHGSIYNFALRADYVLSINDKYLIQNVKSIHFHDDDFLYLIAEKGEDYILTIQLTKANIDKLLTDNVDIFKMAYHRKIEQNAIIVQSIPHTGMCVLEMSRGNIETIELRSVSLLYVKKLIQEHKFKESYDLISFQGLGLDLFVDLEPTIFFSNIHEIFTQLGSFALMDKFILELKDSSTLDAEDLLEFEPESLIEKRSKVCAAFFDAIVRLEEPIKYISTAALVSLLRRSSILDIESALITISKLCQEDYKSHRVAVEGALEILNRYVRYPEQFTAALSIYDLELCEIIGKKSNLNPMEYEPLLLRLQNMEILTRRFTICNNLGKHERALVYLILSNHQQETLDNGEVFKYAVTNKLEKVLYDTLNSLNVANCNEAAKMYADVLMKQDAYHEAGLVLKHADCIEEAVKCFMKGNCWEEAVNLAQDLPNKKDYFYKIASTLEDRNKYKEASIVYKDCLNNIEMAMNTLLNGEHFYEYYRLAKLSNMQTDIESNLKDRMINKVHALALNIQQLSQQYSQSSNRLKEWRQNFVVIENIPMMADEELYDAASTTISRASTSSKSSRSSRRTRKDQRKLTDTRKGGKYEDIAVLKSLHDLVTQSAEKCKELQGICYLLHLISGDSDTIALIRTSIQQATDFEDFMLQTADEIWPAALKRFNPISEEEKCFAHISLIEMKYREKPENLTKRKHGLSMIFDSQSK